MGYGATHIQMELPSLLSLAFPGISSSTHSEVLTLPGSKVHKVTHRDYPSAAYSILVNYRVLFELPEKLALGVGLPPAPAPTSGPNIFMLRVFQESLFVHGLSFSQLYY